MLPLSAPLDLAFSLCLLGPTRVSGCGHFREDKEQREVGLWLREMRESGVRVNRESVITPLLLYFIFVIVIIIIVICFILKISCSISFINNIISYNNNNLVKHINLTSLGLNINFSK